jgi:hypothetical protein
MTIIGLLVVLIVIGLLWWAINALLGAFGVGNPIATVVKVLFVVIVVLWLVSALGYGTGLPRLR